MKKYKKLRNILLKIVILLIVLSLVLVYIIPVLSY